MYATRFLAVGGLATVAQYLLFWLGVDIFGWHAGAASGFGYFVASAISYLLNYFFTFNSSRPHAQTMARFYLMVVIGWSLNTSIVILLCDLMVLNKWLSQTAATTLVLIWNFYASRNLIFRPA